jgi:ubiquinone/menaquinone biosynthesis C-methylase UbiE
MQSTKDFFERAAVDWNDQQRPDRPAVLARLLAPFDPYLSAASRIVEIGTGTGALIPVLAARYPGVRLVSIDLAIAMLLRAGQLNERVSLLEADVHNLPLASATFSAAICHNSFPHFHNHPAALSEIRRALLPGGYLLILHDGGRETINHIHQSASSSTLHHDMLPTGAQMRAMLKANGYDPLVIEDEPDHYLAWAQSLPDLA